ncbi:hypothetical protein ACFQGT_07250 [Natrialbaceae archaeon GCM10025810]|uniref:DUF7284 family protein n=1 Tax=Halovalidus salilacus TaxID=3075124 RepID=UPI003619627D
MDVALALLLISATVLLIGIYLNDDDESIDGDRGDEALQTLSGSTVTITYDLRAPDETGRAAVDSANFDSPENFEPDDVPDLYQITTYGSALDLLGEAAMANLEIGATGLFAYGHDVERSVDGAIRSRLIGSEGNVYAIATWEPYEGASTTGSATAGDRPPDDVDTSSATTDLSGTVPSIDAETLAEAFDEGERGSTRRSGVDDGFDRVGVHVAEAILEAYFPPDRTQYALESSLTENAATVYNYRQLADVVDVDVDEHVTGSNPDAVEANEALRGDPGDEDGLAAVIADDLRDSSPGQRIRETYDEFDDSPTTAELTSLESVFEEELSTDRIEVTVQTWD